MSISKQATQLAYWLQESHKPFLSPGVIDLRCLKSISALYILSVFCPSSVEQAFARVSFKPSCEGGESGSGGLAMLAEGLHHNYSLAHSPVIKSIQVIQITSAPCVQGLRKCPAKGQVGPPSHIWLLLVPTGGPGHVLAYNNFTERTIH